MHTVIDYLTYTLERRKQQLIDAKQKTVIDWSQVSFYRKEIYNLTISIQSILN